MKKTRIFLVISFAVFAIPSLAYAAWWNPFSWFKKSATPPVAKVVQVATTTPQTKPVVATPTTPLVKVKKEAPAVVAKPAVTPSVKNTDQSAEIEELRKEVEELKRQRSSQNLPRESDMPALEVSKQVYQVYPISSLPKGWTAEYLEKIRQDKILRYLEPKGWTAEDLEEFRRNRILHYAEEREKLKLFIEEIKSEYITDIKSRRDKLMWRVSIIRKDRFPESDSHDGAILNKMSDLYAQEHEREIELIDQVLSYINYQLNLLEGYQTEYSAKISELSKYTPKISTQLEIVEIIKYEAELFLRRVDPQSAILDVLGKYQGSVEKYEDTYEREHTIIVNAFSKISGPAVSIPVYHPMPQAPLPIPEIPRTTHCTIGSTGIVGELSVRCYESSF